MTVSPPEAQTEVFPVLDTMRAVAATAVLTTHVAFQTGNYSESLWGTALARLDIGVAVFFVLSGFLLSRPYLLAVRAGRAAPGTRRYLSRRSRRIVPVYVVTVVAALVLLPENEDASVGEWVRNLTLTDIYAAGRLPQGLSQMWSLSAEVAFYAVLPLVMLGARRTLFAGREVRWGWTVLLVALGLNVAWILTALETTWFTASALQWLPTYLTWFAVGMAIAAVQVNVTVSGAPHPTAVALQRLGRLPGTSLTIAGALFLLASTPLAGPVLLQLPTSQQAITKNLLYAAVAGALILPGVFAGRDTRFARVMSWPFLRHLGHISYSVFCIHLIVLDFVVRGLDVALFSGDGLLVFSLTLPLSLLTAEILYRTVERPFMRRPAAPSASPSTETRSSTSVETTRS